MLYYYRRAGSYVALPSAMRILVAKGILNILY